MDYSSENQSNHSNERPKKYKKIPRKDRLELIELILKKGASIKGTARKKGISPSTIRAILRKYERSGTVFETKAEKKERLDREKNEQANSLGFNTHFQSNIFGVPCQIMMPGAGPTFKYCWVNYCYPARPQ